MVHTYYESPLYFWGAFMDALCCWGERHLLEFFSEVDNFFLSLCSDAHGMFIIFSPSGGFI